MKAISRDTPFAPQAVDCARYRPSYQREIYELLASHAPARDIAWDCGTGSGQAAISLSKYFARVIATDSSKEQLANSRPHERVEYRLATAENSGLPDASIDLVTAANAAHWFDRDIFYKEARRILKPQGVIAVWRFDFHKAGIPGIDEQIYRLSEEILDEFWAPNVKRVRGHNYDDVAFPFEEIAIPEWTHSVEWSLDELLGYFNSWSSTQFYIKERGENPIDLIRAKITKHWGAPEQKRVLTSPIWGRIGRNI